MRIFFSKSLLFLVIIVLLVPLMVFGQTIVIPNPLDFDTIEELIDHIIDFLLYVALAVGPIMIIIAGFYFVTAGGNPQQVNKAKDLFLYTIIGVAVVLLAKGLIAVIKSVLGGSPQ